MHIAPLLAMQALPLVQSAAKSSMQGFAGMLQGMLEGISNASEETTTNRSELSLDSLPPAVQSLLQSLHGNLLSLMSLERGIDSSPVQIQFNQSGVLTVRDEKGIASELSALLSSRPDLLSQLRELSAHFPEESSLMLKMSPTEIQLHRSPSTGLDQLRPLG